MRAPRRLWRELGCRGFFGFQLVVGGNVLGALLHPPCMIALIAAFITGSPLSLNEEPVATVLALLYVLSLLAGYASSAVLAAIGLSRQGLTPCAPVLLLTPLHWLLLSLAAWRALYQFVVAPYAWEKTEHGLAKHSRRAVRLAQSLLVLEREVGVMRKARALQRPLGGSGGRTAFKEKREAGQRIDQTRPGQ